MLKRIVDVAVSHKDIKKRIIKDIQSKKRKKIYYFEKPPHVNIGDQAIAFASRSFFEDKVPEYDVVEFYTSERIYAIPIVKRMITKEDIVVIHGGGNLGNLYGRAENARRKLIKAFKENTIVSMPQSVHFSKDSEGKKEEEISRAVYSSHPDLHLVAREDLSLERMNELFPENHVFMTPDIVLSMNSEDYAGDREGVITLIREDKESSLDEIKRTKLLSFLNQYFDKVDVSDTCLKEQAFLTRELSDIAIESKWLEISKHKLAITDRLHGVIFGYVTKTPTIIFDNNNNKVSSTYRTYLQGCKYMRLIDDSSEESLIQAIKELSNVTDFSWNLGDKFTPLVSVFK
ncbi:MAG: polysaccharide pyruvyl transferase family protein [Streptococcaceae bacterium]|jgi:exopolysaccharide biosynthesis predicted pyruvyltransferase EpsI|nr:polysaccharide pyruvyl transferase family protein [Streptococcaceae bacterium]